MEKYPVCTQLETLGKIGFIEGKGTSRVAYSPDFLIGRDYVRSLMEDADLQVTIDPVGNLIGRREGILPLPAVAVGSHLDSVPNGGIYDGCLGVLSGIECIREIRDNGYQNLHPIEIIGFIEEEGNAVGGTFGSKCFTGVPITETERTKAFDLGLHEDHISAAKKNLQDYCAYLELHIEQGGILESQNLNIGIVEGIVAIHRYRCHIIGESNHAGTTPMHLRKDAMEKACRILGDLYQTVSARTDGMVCTVGVFDIPNAAINIIPGKTEFLLELRGTKGEEIDALVTKWEASHRQEGLFVHSFSSQAETLMHPDLIHSIEIEATSLGYSNQRMFSGAGHDAMNMAAFVPSAMIFIPSINGISHSIKEYSTQADIKKGTRLLYETIKKIDEKV